MAFFCFYAGTLKAVRNRDRLRPMTAWVDRVPLPVFRALELIEVLGATGLIPLPLTSIAQAPAAAGGLLLF
ncbi:DoxX family protein [Streptomyces lavendulae]|uniref:DoxX family protein n=1 Tax=Streptomyces lavendulae TaxID=1914 RepID=UPI00369A19DB